MPITKFTGQYSFLSNFYHAPYTFEGRTYKTVEHGYQAAKATNAKDRAKIANADGPGAAKRLGRHIKLRPNWEKIKFDIMHMHVLAKFVQNADLAEKLLATNPQHLEEGNTWGDKIWGTVRGKGQNHLGKILMKVRKELQ